MMIEKLNEKEVLEDPNADMMDKLSVLTSVLTEFMSYESLFLDKLRRFIEDYQNNGGKIYMNKRYCAIVNGKGNRNYPIIFEYSRFYTHIGTRDSSCRCCHYGWFVIIIFL